MTAYSTRDVVDLLGLPPGQVRAYARAGLLDPARGPRRAYQFSFRDLVMFRTARGLSAARIPHARIRRAMGRLRRQLPRGTELSEVRIGADGDRIVASNRGIAWNPESGQFHLDFWAAANAELAPRSRRLAEAAMRGEAAAEDWFDLGCELEASAPAEARKAYQRSLDLDPAHADAHVNLGRLLHADGRLPDAEAHYRVALAIRPAHATAAFNLGIVLEDLGRTGDAVAAYERAVAANPDLADAYFNLARLYESDGRRAAAIRSLGEYRRLERGDGQGR